MNKNKLMAILVLFSDYMIAVSPKDNSILVENISRILSEELAFRNK
ncbi:hypothetical protein [Tepidibacter aestuarii]|nr:hypothetical protein [Tepidibacter aestuarii]CAH2212986.1 protein of unknown function [Tepidibacter aestuarii]